MAKNTRRDLVERMYMRLRAEKVVNDYVLQLVTNLDYGGAKEFVNTSVFELYLEKDTIILDKENNLLKLGKEEFKYDYTYLNDLCLSLLSDVHEV